MKRDNTTNTLLETQQLAKDFVSELHAGDVVMLYGNLGAGKTTFTQGLAKGFGIQKRLISPTFVIMRTYTIPKLTNILLYHVDLYRLQNELDIESTGLLEILHRKDAIVVIEWPEKMGALLPKKRWEVKLSYRDENQRDIHIEKYE